MSDNSKSIFYLLAGAAIGAAIGYYLAVDDKEEIMNRLQNAADDVKEKLDQNIARGKKIVNELKNSVNDLFDKA